MRKVKENSSKKIYEELLEAEKERARRTGVLVKLCSKLILIVAGVWLFATGITASFNGVRETFWQVFFSAGMVVIVLLFVKFLINFKFKDDDCCNENDW